MKTSHRKIRIGIIGCGAIGSRIAISIKKELKNSGGLTALYDIHPQKALDLAEKLKQKNVAKKNYDELLRASDLVVEAVSAPETTEILRRALQKKKHVLAMSVGKLLNAQSLFRLAKTQRCHILIPSGAIAGIDAIKAAGLAHIDSVTLTTRKPPSGFTLSPAVAEKGIHLEDITSETVIFDGDVQTAVKLFPKNINVAATIALACGVKNKMSIRILTSPQYTTNSHEIEVRGDFGRLLTRTDNQVCPDNPKTSYLAVLSAIQTLKQFFQEVKIGT